VYEDSIGRIVSNLNINEFYLECVDPKLVCTFFRERERERKNMARIFDILDSNTRQYRRCNAVGRQITARLIPPSDNSDPVTHFLASVNDLIEHVLHDVGDSDMVGITIQNQENQNDKPIGKVAHGKFNYPRRWYGAFSKRSPCQILGSMLWTRWS